MIGIKQAFDEIQTQLLVVLAEGSDPVPTFGLGEMELAQLDSTPRIIFVPHGGPIRMSRNTGAIEVGTLWERTCRFSAHIWHDDITAAEILANHLVAAIHFCRVGCYSVVGENWDTKAYTAEGVLMTLEFQVVMLFAREGFTTVKADLPPIMTTHLEAVG